jgi:hypothetical protein
LAFMCVILLMTGETILRRGLQVCDGTCIQMTIGTDHIHVFANQLKSEVIVFEAFTITIYTIVTSETACTKCKDMGLGEGQVYLDVAVLAGI